MPSAGCPRTCSRCCLADTWTRCPTQRSQNDWGARRGRYACSIRAPCDGCVRNATRSNNGLLAGGAAMKQFTRQFWSGFLAGSAIGLGVAAMLVEQELITLQRKAWVGIPASLLAGAAVIVFKWGRKPQ